MTSNSITPQAPCFPRFRAPRNVCSRFQPPRNVWSCSWPPIRNVCSPSRPSTGTSAPTPGYTGSHDCCGKWKSSSWTIIATNLKSRADISHRFLLLVLPSTMQKSVGLPFLIIVFVMKNVIFLYIACLIHLKWKAITNITATIEPMTISIIYLTYSIIFHNIFRFGEGRVIFSTIVLLSC